MRTVVPKTDAIFCNKHIEEVVSMMREYREIVGKGWPPYNPKDKDYRSLEEWFYALKDALEEAKKKQKLNPKRS